MIGTPDLNEMKPEEILDEVASILAKGYLRISKMMHSQGNDITANSSPLTEKELDFSGHRSPNSDAG